MRRALTALIAIAPGIRAQVARRPDPVLVSPAAVLVVSPLTAGVARHGPAIGGGGSLLGRTLDGSRALGQPFAGGLEVGLALDSLRTPQRRGHPLLGAVLGLGLGAQAYLASVARDNESNDCARVRRALLFRSLDLNFGVGPTTDQ